MALRDERRIRRLFDRAAELLAKKGAEPVFTAAGKARELAGLVAPEARFDIPECGVGMAAGGSALARQIALVRAQAQFIQIAFEELRVDFTAEDAAIATADVLFKGTSDLLGLSGRDARELTATLKRDSDSGEWRFTGVRLRPVIEK